MCRALLDSFSISSACKCSLLVRRAIIGRMVVVFCVMVFFLLIVSFGWRGIPYECPKF